jgi:hypothetical protein
MMERVQVTAPPLAGAALRTAKFDAVPSDGADEAANAGKVPPSSAVIPSRQEEKYFSQEFMVLPLWLFVSATVAARMG